MVAQGWAIDKNGGISRWGISEPTNKRHYGQEMTDYANKIREQKLENMPGKNLLYTNDVLQFRNLAVCNVVQRRCGMEYRSHRTYAVYDGAALCGGSDG